MVAHRLVEALTDRDDRRRDWQIDVFAEESRPPYDRVALTSFFSGRDPDDLLLGDPGLWRRDGVRLHTNAAVKRIDTDKREVHARGRVFRVRRTGHRHRVLPRDPPGARERPARIVRLPHRRRRHASCAPGRPRAT